MSRGNKLQMNNDGYEILIVEDSPAQTEQLKHTLGQHGYNVATAYNGKEALSYLSEHKPQMVISDIVMPEMGGYELCRAIRKDDILRETPVILLTSSSCLEDVNEALKCGADNLMRKPYDEKLLRFWIDNILINRRLRSSNKVEAGVELYLGGNKHLITTERQQIVDLLISMYEQAVYLSNNLEIRERQLDRSNQILIGIYNIARGLNQATTEKEIIEEVLERVLELPDIKAGWIFIRISDTEFKLAAAKGSPDALNIPCAMEGDCLCKRKVLSDEIEKSSNVLECERLLHAKNNMLGLRSHVTLPLRFGSRVLGIMNLVGTADVLFSEDDLRVLNSIGDQIGIAIERCRMNEHLEELVSERTARLWESELWFRTVFNSQQDAMFVLTTDQRIIGSNTAAKEMLGYSIDKIKSLSTEIFHVDHEHFIRFGELTRKAFEKNGAARFEFKLKRKNGNVFPTEHIVSLLHNNKNELKGILSVVRDITERKRAEEEIIFQKNRFAQLFDNSPIAIALLDNQDKIVLINESFSILFGYFLEEIKGKSLTDLIVPPELKEEAKHYSDQTREGYHINKESCRRKKDGTTIYVQIIGIPVAVNDKTIGIYGMYVDLTQRKKAEEELTKAKEQSEGLNRLKNFFLSNMSHELRTPLISVLGFAELLQQELKDPEHLEFVNNIIEGGQRLNSTLSGILEISKLETANSFLNLQPYNLADEIKARVKSFLPMAQSKRLFLKTELSDTYLNAHIDSELFGKALYHLVSNGIKFTKKGGVFVSLNHVRKQDQDCAVTKVIDTGVGIPKENFDKIFSAFSQLDEGYSKSHEGTGLGLTIAKRIVELMKGKIEVESEVGKGSVFSIWLPAILDESQIEMKVKEKRRTIIIEPPTIKEKGLKKVLVVENNSSNRFLIKNCLSTYVRIIEAEDGISGVSMASKEHFDLILMDINLGADIDGIGAMHQIRKIPGYACVPIIAVTAYVMFGDREWFLNEGFDDYLAKPFTKDALVSLVEKTFAKVKK
ncbi:MAG: response regulator [Melioribacteraceae bacterium]